MKYKTAITKYKITNYILEMSATEFKKTFNGKFKKFQISEKLHLSTATTKAIDKI